MFTRQVKEDEMLKQEKVDNFYIRLELPKEVTEQIRKIKKFKRMSLAQIASEAVAQYIADLSHEAEHFCNVCGEFHPESEFYTARGKIQNQCKAVFRRRGKEWYRKNKDYANKKSRILRQISKKKDQDALP